MRPLDPTNELREEAAACDFVAQYLADRERGVERELGEYQACFSEFAARIAAEHAALQADVVAQVTPPSQVDGRVVGPYRLIEKLGHGGQGIVFLAEHRELGRTVALKMLHQGVLGLSLANRARLRREAILVANLEHPGLCQVYEVELDGAEPYLAMRYVPGRSLAAEIEQARETPDLSELPPRSRNRLNTWLAFFERAAHALHAAHLAGVVHRDVKPHNLMRTPDGEPVLLDFGLARNVTSTSVMLTQPHELFGTLSYMAPEHLSGNTPPDARQDVYSLGVTLYETVTLQQPFAAPNPEALWQRIQSGDLPRPGSFNHALPRDLEVILATALERDPARRYATASAFAEDLRRLRLGEPILASPLSRTVRMRRWVRRHPVFSVAFVLLAAGLTVCLALLIQLSRSRQETQRSNRGKAAIGAAYLALGSSEVEPSLALANSVAAAREVDGPEIRDIVMQVLDRCWTERELGADWFVRTTTCAPCVPNGDGTLVAVPTFTGEVFVVRVATGELVARLPSQQRGRTFAVFGPEGDELLVAGTDGVLCRWRLDGPEPVRLELPPPTGVELRAPTTALAITFEGHRIARCDRNGAIELHDVSGSAPPIRAVGHSKGIPLAYFDPSGARLLTVSKGYFDEIEGDYAVHIVDATTGGLLQAFGPYRSEQAPEHATWSPDGRWIAIAHDDGLVDVFDASSGVAHPDLQVSLPSNAKCVAFSPDGSRLLTGSNEGLVVFDCATGRECHRISDFGERAVAHICTSPDKRTIAVAAFDGTCRLLDAASLAQIRSLPIGPRFDSMCWAQLGTRLVGATSGRLHVLHALDRPFLADLREHTRRIVQVHFDRSGTRLLSASQDGLARVWSLESWSGVARFEHRSALRSARFSGLEDRVVTTCENAAPRVWSMQSGACVELGTAPASDAWFFDSDRQIVTIGDEGWARGFDSTTGHLLFERRLHGPNPAWQGRSLQEQKIECAAWHPTEPLIATGAGDRTISVFNCMTRQEVFHSEPWPWTGTIKTGRRVFGLAFTPDGQRVVAAGEDKSLHAWNITDHELSWRGAVGITPGPIGFLDAGRLLVSCRWSPGLLVVRTMDQDREPVDHRMRSATACLRFDASGRLALCADKAGRLAVFDTRPWALRFVVTAAEVPLVDAEFSLDGCSVVTGDAAGRIRVWPVDPVAVAEKFLPTRILSTNK